MWEQVQGSHQEESELQMVSAARMGPGRGLLALHSLPPHSPGQVQAGSQQEGRGRCQ